MSRCSENVLVMGKMSAMWLLTTMVEVFAILLSSRWTPLTLVMMTRERTGLSLKWAGEGRWFWQK